MANTSYSFLDLAGVIVHPSLGIYTFTGEGVGSVAVAMATEKVSQEVAADGSVMSSWVAGDNGTITISCQQTSPVHKWLLNWYNYIKFASTNEKFAGSGTIRNTQDGTSHVFTGAAPGKIPDKQYQAQGQQVAWVLNCADIQSVTA
jgi:hypothetical protein